MTKPIPIVEVFGPTLQGEGALIGRPTLFVRTGGCDYRCTWCDSMYAVDAKAHGDTWERLTEEELVTRVVQQSDGHPVDLWCTLSGGNPAMWPLGDVVRTLQHRYGMCVAMETQGSLCPDWITEPDHVCISPKPPSAGMSAKGTPWDLLLETVQARESVYGWWNDRADVQPTVLKVVVFDQADLDFAVAVRSRVPGIPLYLQAGTPRRPDGGDWPHSLRLLKVLEATRTLEDMVQRQRLRNVVVLPQLHAMLYVPTKGV